SLPKPKLNSTRPTKQVNADHVAGLVKPGVCVRRKAHLVGPSFRLSLTAEPMNAQPAFDVIHSHAVPPCLPFPTVAGGCQVMMLRLAEGLRLPLGPDDFADYARAMEAARFLVAPEERQSVRGGRRKW